MDKLGLKVFKISAATNSGLIELMKYAASIIDTVKEDEVEPQDMYVKEDKKFTYTINKAEDGAFEVTGSFVDRLLRSVNIYDDESLRYFHKVISEKGIIDELKSMGIKEGDTVRMDTFEFEFLG